MSRTGISVNVSSNVRKNVDVYLLVAMLLIALAQPMWAGDKEKDEETLTNASGVLQTMLADKNIPREVLEKADCIVVLPDVKKVGFVVGGSGGRGPMVCRTGDRFSGKWSPPAMYKVGGVSAGLQAGASSSDFVLLIMTEKGVNAVLNGKTKMGADATVAAGPGATAHTVTGSDILTYGKSQGLFAGVSLSGASLEPDNDANNRLYGKAVTPAEIVRQSEVQPTTGGEAFVSLLDSKAPSRSDQ
jgi:SH3 domain-containing YSC84-like protein 1